MKLSELIDEIISGHALSRVAAVKFEEDYVMCYMHA